MSSRLKQFFKSFISLLYQRLHGYPRLRRFLFKPIEKHYSPTIRLLHEQSIFIPWHSKSIDDLPIEAQNIYRQIQQIQRERSV